MELDGMRYKWDRIKAISSISKRKIRSSFDLVTQWGEKMRRELMGFSSHAKQKKKTHNNNNNKKERGGPVLLLYIRSFSLSLSPKFFKDVTYI